MHDPERVRFGDSFASLVYVKCRFVNGQRSSSLQDLPQIFPVEMLHQHVRRAVGELPDIVNAGDVLAGETCITPAPVTASITAREIADD